MRPTLPSLIWLFGCTTVLLAQDQPHQPTAGTSTVSGRVFCSDTNAPARMARVFLQPAELVDAYDENKHDGVATQGEAVQTALDGTFEIPHVAPGTYYVIASLPGYSSPLASLVAEPWRAMELEDPASRKKIASSVPRVAVQAGLPASVNVSLERGAAVSGTIRFDDGTPASGITVKLLVQREKEWVPLGSNPFPMQNQQNVTDDQGAYRISGVPGQKYVLEAEASIIRMEFSSSGKGTTGMSMGGHQYSFSTYFGNTMRLKEAKPFSIKAGEELRGEDVEIPAAKLHTVRGGILALRDAHVLNGGSVSLLYPDDMSQASWAWVSNADDNSFQLNFVPEGDYILEVHDAADNEYVESRDPNNNSITQIMPHALRSYGQARMPIHIAGDMSGLTISVPDLAGQAQPNH